MAENTYASLLDNFTKELYSNIIVAEDMIADVPLLKALEKHVDRASFDTNGNVKVLMQTQRARNARGLRDGSNLQTANASAFVEQTIPIKRLVAICGLTEKNALLLDGGNSSWGPIARRTLDDCILDFKNLQNFAAHSNGSGAIARVYDDSGANAPSYSAGDLTLVCDNAYVDSNIENVSAIQRDMYLSIWDTSGSAWLADGSGATEWRVKSVSPGRRTAGGSWAAVTGSVVLTGLSSDISGNIDDNDVLYVAGCAVDDGGAYPVGELPMGITGIVANANLGSYDDQLTAPFNLTSFQGLTRATTYPSLNSDIWKASDFSADADDTPTENWDLSVLGDAMEEVVNRGGKTRMVRCHPQMARCMRRLSQSSNSINVVVSDAKSTNQTIVGDIMPDSFMEIEGEVIPIVRDRWCPRYQVEGIDTSVLRWHPKGNADWRKDFGSIWGPTRGSRATTIEAGYQWWYEMSSERCDWHWRVQDLAII